MDQLGKRIKTEREVFDLLAVDQASHINMLPIILFQKGAANTFLSSTTTQKIIGVLEIKIVEETAGSNNIYNLQYVNSTERKLIAKHSHPLYKITATGTELLGILNLKNNSSTLI